MNFTKKICLILACALAVFAGCKKPMRPTPDQTMVGSGTNVNPGDATNFGLTDPSAAGLNTRGEGRWEGPKGYDILEAVFFDFDKSSIKESERPKLQAAKEYLEKHPDQGLLVEGHCDWRGTEEYNMGLGDRRASAVKNYLVKLGVSADKIEIISLGAKQAKEKGSPAETAKDRRGELVVLQK